MQPIVLRGAAVSCSLQAAIFRTPRSLVQRNGRRLLSLSTTNALSGETMMAPVEGSVMPYIARHGPKDGMIVLNVGGTEFQTLKSTVALNPVLAEHLSRMKPGENSIFIDRDPTHFGIILQYLRNRMDGIVINNAFMSAKSKMHSQKYVEYVKLPTDSTILSELYIEVCHFRMDHLKYILCKRSFWANLVNTLGITSNPFDAVKNLATRARQAMLAVGGVTTMSFGLNQSEDGKEGAFHKQFAKLSKDFGFDSLISPAKK
mmetsp:Transcript_15579/g.28315  ORF Transcript_15579/g.28315 Transcript_15579/m.28315 type:complete len:260 (-) Transcript_15579:938-1717(-)